MIGIYDNYPFILGMPPTLEMSFRIDSLDFSIDSIPGGPKTFRAWADLNGNGAFDSTAVYEEPNGWYDNDMAGMVPIGGGLDETVDITIGTGDVPENIPMPDVFGVRCLPNPFNSATTVLVVGRGEPISAKVYNLSGREVVTLFENTVVNGVTAFRFAPPENMPSGNYLIRAISGGESFTSEFTYMK